MLSVHAFEYGLGDSNGHLVFQTRDGYSFCCKNRENTSLVVCRVIASFVVVWWDDDQVTAFRTYAQIPYKRL